MKRKPKQPPTRRELLALYELLRSYCRRERADVPASNTDMVEDWQQLCRMVGVNPAPSWRT